MLLDKLYPSEVAAKMLLLRVVAAVVAEEEEAVEVEGVVEGVVEAPTGGLPLQR